MVLVDGVPAEVSAVVMETTATAGPGVPVLGCSAGPCCHGEVVVLHDLLGIAARDAAFQAPTQALREVIPAAARWWLERVEGGHTQR